MKTNISLSISTLALACATEPRPPVGPAVDAGAVDSGAIDAGSADPAFPRVSCGDVRGACAEFKPDQIGALLDAVNELEDGTTIVLGSGRFALDNALTIRRTNRVTLLGQGKDVTFLDFAGQRAQSNGVDVIGDDFTIAHLTIQDSKKDGLRVEESRNVRIQHLKVTWSAGPVSTNGGYGIYPVRCVGVLLEDSEAYHASDAGIYVGSSINAILRRNVARRNVAGFEIENTQFAEVYENVAEDNTAGLMVFDLPGNPVIGRDVRVFDNVVRANNRPNFAASGATVAGIPSGTGTFVLASRRVEITSNTYADNGTADIAVLSGLALQSSTAAWTLALDAVRGSTAGLALPSDGTHIQNFVTNEIWIHGNTHAGSGTMPDVSDPVLRAVGAILGLVYGAAGQPVDSIVYDGIMENVDPSTPANNTNLNHVCVEDEEGASFVTLDLPKLGAILGGGGAPTIADVYRPSAPFAPFDCSGFSAGPISPVTL